VSKILTFSDLNRIAAEHQVAEAARNAPVAVARRAVYTLASALGELSAEERRAVFALLAEEVGRAVADPAPVIA
jgi:hypothetical protein